MYRTIVPSPPPPRPRPQTTLPPLRQAPSRPPPPLPPQTTLPPPPSELSPSEPSPSAAPPPSEPSPSAPSAALPPEPQEETEEEKQEREKREEELDKFKSDYLTCPITFDLMEDPVLASDGYTYERKAIEEAAAREEAVVAAKNRAIERNGGWTRGEVYVLSPITREPILLRCDNPYDNDEDLDSLFKPLLIPNRICKQLIDAWRADQLQSLCPEIQKNRKNTEEKIRNIMQNKNIMEDDEDFYQYMRDFRNKTEEKIRNIMKEKNISRDAAYADEDFYQYMRDFRNNKTRKHNNSLLDLSKMKFLKFSRKNRKNAIAPAGGSKKRKSIKKRKQKKRGRGKTKKI